MEAEHLELRTACRRVAQHHIEAVTAADVQHAMKVLTPEQIRAGMQVMAQQAKFGDVAAYSKPSALKMALKQVQESDPLTGKTILARGITQHNRMLQCAVLENLDDELHQWCVAEIRKGFPAEDK